MLGCFAKVKGYGKAKVVKGRVYTWSQYVIYLPKNAPFVGDEEVVVIRKKDWDEFVKFMERINMGELVELSDMST